MVCATASTMLFAPPAGAQVSGVSGGAFGFKASVSLFGGPANNAGPLPTVTLPSSGATPPVTATEAQTEAKFGPAVIFSSGAITVSTEGSVGAGGSATSSVDIRNVNRSLQEVFTAGRLQSSCRAGDSGASGSTTMTGGLLRTSEGADLDGEGDDTEITLPNDPAPNTEHQGAIETVGDTYRIIFNEQIPQAGGITVNAAHMFLLGPTAVGELIVGQSVCAVSGGGSTGGGGGGTTTTTAGSGSAGGGSGGSGGSGSTGGSGGSGGSAGSSGGAGNMPKTGFDALPLAVVGSEMVVGGVAAVLWGSRRRRWPRR